MVRLADLPEVERTHALAKRWEPLPGRPFVRGPALGEQVVSTVDLVCFTGSVATGRRVGAAAASRMIPAFLELGGKDAAVVLASSDLDHAAAAVLWASSVNAGASCLSVERVYVDAAVHDAFVAALVRRASAVTLGFPAAGSGQVGPIIFRKQAETISRHLRDATGRGAVVHCGGEVPEPGPSFSTRAAPS